VREDKRLAFSLKSGDPPTFLANDSLRRFIGTLWMPHVCLLL